MRYAHILSRLTGAPWFITESGLRAVTDLLEARLSGVRFDPLPPPSSDPECDLPEPSYLVRSAGGIAIVNAKGILGKHLDLLEQSCGGCDYDQLVSTVRAAAADPAISTIILAIDSRGGTAVGCTEAHAALADIRATSGKRLLGFTDTLAASAGYYLLAACDAIFCTPTAILGSIGSIRYVEDQTEANAKAGIKRFAIKSASMKDVGNPDRPMTDEERAFLQAHVDYYGALFRRDMQAARPQLTPDLFATGLYYIGAEAQTRGLADAIVSSLDELIASLVSTSAI